jgi:hypothetical protein
MAEFTGLFNRAIRKLQLFGRVRRMNQQIAARAVQEGQQKPIVFFNASARLEGLNLNAAFSLISSWGVQLAGRKVVHFACKAGMSQCVLGAGLGDPKTPPPCQGCIQYTRLFTGAAETAWFEYQEDHDLRRILTDKSVKGLESFSYQERPLGELVLPSLRWILRRHHLEENPLTHQLFSEYILSAHNIAVKFTETYHSIKPDTVVLFNGLQYPEAVVRWISKQQGIRVITHEVNLQPYSAFFTDGQATIYPMTIPEDFQLSENQNQVLDKYLEKRFKGDFRMAGIKFWSKMDQLPGDFLSFAREFNAIVPVFTNVIFDTSQAHANTLFKDMFEWLDLVVKKANENPDILFVIRAHPDEMRKGKSSQESVTAWAEQRGVVGVKNIKLIHPDETLSSYELIQRSKFTMVYNSSIGLEASLLGAAVLCAGKARYTQYPIVFYPESRTGYIQTLDSFLAKEQIEIPEEFYSYARKFLYYQLYRVSLPFDEYLFEHPTPGYVQIKKSSWKNFSPGASPVLDCVVSGIVDGSPFVLENDLS